MSSPRSALDESRKFWLLAAVCLSALGLPLSFTGPAVALPAIRDSLGGSPVQLNWVTNAFMLSFGGSLMAAGTLADAFGRKRLFLLGTAALAATSLALACAPDILWFDGLRAVQGLGAAAAFAAGTAALAQVFDSAARTRAFSLLGTTFGGGLAFGPVLSGWLIGVAGWRGGLIAVGALGLAALGIGACCMRESRNPQARGLDLPGTASFTAALSLMTFGVLQAPESGWSNGWVLAALAGALLMSVTFVAIERRAAHPMLDLTLFRLPRFVGVQLLAAAPAYAYVVLLVLLPIRFAGLEGRSPLETGQFMVALSAPMLVMPSVAVWLRRWFSAGLISATGLLVCAVGLFWLSHCEAGSSMHTIASPMLLIGLGIGLPWGLMDGLAVSVVPRERAGMAAGIFSTVRVAGEGLALALVSAGLTALLQTRLGPVTGASSVALSQAAQRIATGDLSQALGFLPGFGRAAVLHAYSESFSFLLRILSAVTVLTAAVVFAFLRDEGREQVPHSTLVT